MLYTPGCLPPLWLVFVSSFGNCTTSYEPQHTRRQHTCYMLSVARRLTGCPVSLISTVTISRFADRLRGTTHSRAMSDSAAHTRKRAKVDTEPTSSTGNGAPAAGGGGQRRPVRIAIEGNIGERKCALRCPLGVCFLNPVGVTVSVSRIFCGMYFL